MLEPGHRRRWTRRPRSSWCAATHGDHTAYASLLEQKSDGEEMPALDPDAVRMILYTSGTTGRPKGVLHSHNSIHALICQLRDHWLIEPGDKFLVPSPIAHIGGSIYAFECPLLLGTTAVLMERWDPDEAVKIMAAEGCTHMAGATPFLEGLLAAAERADTRLPDLKVFICGGASVPPSLIRRAAAYFERAVVTRVYGSTEVPVTTVGSPTDPEHAADTDGRRRHRGHQARRARRRAVRVGRDPRPRTPDAGRLPKSRGRAGLFRRRRLFPHRRSRAVGGRRLPRRDRPGQGHHHPQRREHRAEGDRGHSRRPPRHRRRSPSSACPMPAPESGRVRSSCRRPPPAPTSTACAAFLADYGVAKFKVPEQVVIWDSLPKNDAGKVLKHQIRAALTKADG